MKLTIKIIVLTIIIFLIGALVSWVTKDVINKNQKQTAVNAGPVTSPGPEKTAEEIEQERRLEYFLEENINVNNNNLAHYPTFKNQVNIENIKRVFNLKLKESAGWLVEVEKTPDYLTYYLLTPSVEKELEHSMSSNYQDDNNFCTLKKVETVGNEESLNRNLEDKNGYLILTGSCETYGNGSFVSVYKLTTGEKVKLAGVSTTAITPSGNTRGRLKGVYGVFNPTLVVEYGGFENAGSKLQEIDSLGFFDLQTGNLKQSIEFN